MRFLKLNNCLILFLLLQGCSETHTDDKEGKISSSQAEEVVETKLQFSILEANRLVELPLNCAEQEYPNKLNQVISSADDLKSPKELHPAFYGCFDWHSSVHGHWSMVKLLKDFPELEEADEIRRILKTNISKENIEDEISYFDHKWNKSFERTYGWAWLLKLAEELNTWEDSLAIELSENLKPLEDLIVKKHTEFLPKLHYPIRVGEHTNTAFGLSFALDYAITKGNKEFQAVIESRAKDFYLNDIDSPIRFEPSGYDFLSPSLEEAELMLKVLGQEEFDDWFKKFLPTLAKNDANLEVGIVADRTDGKLVHLDGLNFSRAWCLYAIANSNSKYEYLRAIANQHVEYSLPNLVGDSYEGGHWLASFAIYALDKQ